ncbi:hypothetical protein [Photorhabdus khanii]|uniref:Uncharacterized protein n=1 Tax=Photorhabdus khanii subsp. guanajuatensis TaxID=2100166 RepID=A0A4R4JFY1_9GAMM|nr:hypothetical protein [Photorhabdus khanii]TDB52311.1 hypothetical protein C5467_16150 [Photorhabdus khanii subsp. guanajuatensis]
MVRKIFPVIIGLVFPLYFNTSFASYISSFETEKFNITINVLCPEGEITCDNVIYTGTRKKDRAILALKGKTLNRNCKTGTCNLYGYEFVNGDTVYTIYLDGILEITRGNKLLLSEVGKWNSQQ